MPTTVGFGCDIQAAVEVASGGDEVWLAYFILTPNFHFLTFTNLSSTPDDYQPSPLSQQNLLATFFTHTVVPELCTLLDM